MNTFRSLTICVFVAAWTFVVVSPAAAQDETPIDPMNQSQLVEAADAAMTAGEFDRAMELWDVLRDRMPQSPQVPFNMGVAAYRQGQYDRAAELFAQALSMTSDPKLRSDSAYNLGTSAYAQSLDSDMPMVSPNATQQLDQASEQLQRSLAHYRQALDLAPDDADARANAELAYRRLQNLEAMKREMQQNSPQQQQQPQEQPDDDQQQQQNQDQQNDEQQDSPQQNQDQQQQNESQQQTSQSNSQEQQQPNEDQQQQNPDSSASNEQPEQLDEQSDVTVEPDAPQQPPRESQDRAGMSRDEAERLLQMVRDKQRQRQEQRKRQQASRLPPVDKDW